MIKRLREFEGEPAVAVSENLVSSILEHTEAYFQSKRELFCKKKMPYFLTNYDNMNTCKALI